MQVRQVAEVTEEVAATSGVPDKQFSYLTIIHPRNVADVFFVMHRLYCLVHNAMPYSHHALTRIAGGHLVEKLP